MTIASRDAEVQDEIAFAQRVMQAQDLYFARVRVQDMRSNMKTQWLQARTALEFAEANLRMIEFELQLIHDREDQMKQSDFRENDLDYNFFVNFHVLQDHYADIYGIDLPEAQTDEVDLPVVRAAACSFTCADWNDDFVIDPKEEASTSCSLLQIPSTGPREREGIDVIEYFENCGPEGHEVMDLQHGRVNINNKTRITYEELHHKGNSTATGGSPSTTLQLDEHLKPWREYLPSWARSSSEAGSSSESISSSGSGSSSTSGSSSSGSSSAISDETVISEASSDSRRKARLGRAAWEQLRARWRRPRQERDSPNPDEDSAESDWVPPSPTEFSAETIAETSRVAGDLMKQRIIPTPGRQMAVDYARTRDLENRRKKQEETETKNDILSEGGNEPGQLLSTRRDINARTYPVDGRFSTLRHTGTATGLSTRFMREANGPCFCSDEETRNRRDRQVKRRAKALREADYTVTILPTLKMEIMGKETILTKGDMKNLQLMTTEKGTRQRLLTVKEANKKYTKRYIYEEKEFFDENSDHDRFNSPKSNEGRKFVLMPKKQDENSDSRGWTSWLR
ncbi:unnamed protein product [Amoebophrya sp. A120]|nr:unnamed protein product [Amoebophrya sp. A120]|eukprot:GSA120T00016809001.1